MFIISSAPAVIPRDVLESSLRQLVGPHGSVKLLIIARSARGAWTAAIELDGDARRALEALRGATIAGNPVRARIATPRDVDSIAS